MTDLMPQVPSFNAPSRKQNVVPVSMEVAAILNSYDRRLHTLEQLITGDVGGRLTAVEEGNLPGGVIIDGEVIDLSPANAPINVTATPGTYFENIYIDVEWDEDPDSDIDAVSFDVEIIHHDTLTLINSINTSANNYRWNNLEPLTQYDFRVYAVTRLGVRSTTFGSATATTERDNTAPPAPDGLALARGATTVVVRFDGLTEEQAPDVAWGHGNYEIEIDTANSFDTANFRSMISSATVVAFNDIVGELPQWYARVRAIDSSGNVSEWSDVAGPSGPMGGTVDAMIVAGLSAAKITVGEMSGDRIQANTLDAGRIKTSSITAANITLSGGAFIAGSPISDDGLLINSQGLRLYKDGTPVMIFDATTGNATFAGNITSTAVIAGGELNGALINGGTINGTVVNAGILNGGNITGTTITGSLIQTATSGQRVNLRSSNNRLEFFSGHANETVNGFIETGISLTWGGYLHIRAPRMGGDATSRFVMFSRTPSLGSAIQPHADTLELIEPDEDSSADLLFRAGLNRGTGDYELASFDSAGEEIFLARNNVVLSYRPGGALAWKVESLTSTASASWSLTNSGFPAWNALSTVSGHIDVACATLIETSSSQFKENIESLVVDDRIDSVQPKRYERKYGVEAQAKSASSTVLDEQFGFVAEELVDIYPEMVVTDENGDPFGIRVSMFIPVLLGHVQDLRSRVAALEAA